MTTRLAQEAARQSQRMLRALGGEYRRSREDAGLSQRQVATAAGISQSHYSTIEAGTVVASVELHERIALALGGQLNVRFYPGTGPRLWDRFQAPMVEAFIRILHPRWQRFPEVVVQRPAYGVIDLALADPPKQLLVATEFQSQLRRLEQQIRWARTKALGLAETSVAQLLTGSPTVERLLVLRSTAATRALAREFEATLSAAYPARTADVLASLTGAALWPGSGIVWITIDKGDVHVMDRRPPGVRLGS